jgi:uncharacterized membrane protein YbhN (UPF0104 family)
MVWLLFRDTDWTEVREATSDANWPLLIAALVPLVIQHITRIRRWSFIVRAAYPATFRQMFSATQIGFLANFTLPGRVGEAIRALVLSRLTQLPFSKSLAFVAVDRITDLFGLIAVLAVSVIAFQPEGIVSIPAATFGTDGPIEFDGGDYRKGAALVGVALAGIIGAFVVIYKRRGIFIWLVSNTLGRVSEKLAGFINGMINHFADGLHVFRSPLDMARSIGWSFITWGFGLLGFTLGLMAFHIDFPWYTPFVMNALLAIAISLPNAPGFVGQFHIPLVLGLVMTAPALDVNIAKAYAIAMHLWQLPPVLIFGIWCLLRENMNLVQLQREGEAQAHEVQEEAVADSK